jgi:hypothetical protein
MWDKGNLILISVSSQTEPEEEDRLIRGQRNVDDKWKGIFAT